MRQIIEVAEWKRHETIVVEEDAFQLRPDRKRLWLQKAACWVLRKLGAYRRSTAIAHTRHQIDTADFVEKLYKARRAVIEQLARSPGTLLIGPEEFAEMIGGAIPQSMIQFNAAIDWRDQNGYRVIGMRVVVVPWMVGVLPVPDDIVGK